MTPITDLSQLDPNGSYTYADYLTWRFTEYVELIKGRIMRKMSAPTSQHQTVASKFHGEIYGYLKGRPCQIFSAPFDVRLIRSTGNGDAQIQTVVQPDISIICNLNKIDRRGCVGAPDWIIEIVSPSSLALDTSTDSTCTPKTTFGSIGSPTPASKPFWPTRSARTSSTS